MAYCTKIETRSYYSPHSKRKTSRITLVGGIILLSYSITREQLTRRIKRQRRIDQLRGHDIVNRSSGRRLRLSPALSSWSRTPSGPMRRSGSPLRLYCTGTPTESCQHQTYTWSLTVYTFLLSDTKWTKVSIGLMTYSVFHLF